MALGAQLGITTTALLPRLRPASAIRARPALRTALPRTHVMRKGRRGVPTTTRTLREAASSAAETPLMPSASSQMKPKVPESTAAGSIPKARLRKERFHSQRRSHQHRMHMSAPTAPSKGLCVGEERSATGRQHIRWQREARAIAGPCQHLLLRTTTPAGCRADWPRSANEEL